MNERKALTLDEIQKVYGLSHEDKGSQYGVNEHGQSFKYEFEKDTKEWREGPTLADFSAIITDETMKDDGVETTRELTLQGWAAGKNRPLPSIKIKTKDLTAQKLTELWGSSANIRPSNGYERQMLYMIKSSAAIGEAPERTVYTHTGWREIGGKWVYLYSGGAITPTGNAEHIETDLTDKTGMYKFPDKGGPMRYSLDLLKVAPARVVYPLLGFLYLAPLYEFVSAAPVALAMTPALVGRTQSGKTTLSTLLLSHFGTEFTDKNLPASFKDSKAALRDKAFRLKDALLLVDDHHPEVDLKERSRMNDLFSMICAMWGDGDAADRANADGSARASKPPRGLGFITAEHRIEGSQSRSSRIYYIDVKPGEIQFNKDLTRLQTQARAGDLAAGMRSFIENMLPLAGPELSRKLCTMFTEELDRVNDLLKDLETMKRQPAQIAWLMVGLKVYLKALEHAHEITHAEKEKHLQRAQEIMVEEARHQADELEQQSVERIFLDSIKSLIQSDKAAFKSIREGKVFSIRNDRAEFIGYDSPAEGMVYLLPDASYRAVINHYSSMHMVFPINSRNQMGCILRDAHILEPRNNKERTPQRLKKFPGEEDKVTVWYIPRRFIFDTTPDEEQPNKTTSGHGCKSPGKIKI